MECIEYYGAKQGITACKDWYDDFIECQTGGRAFVEKYEIFE